MSITISNWKQICDAPTNNSPSKMAYSFPKAPLPSPDKENKYSTFYERSQVFYNIASKPSVRATSFGYGNKCDFTKEYLSLYLVYLLVLLPIHIQCLLILSHHKKKKEVFLLDTADLKWLSQAHQQRQLIIKIQALDHIIL